MRRAPVPAHRFTHVSIHATDMEESLRFYAEMFGMERVISPDFEQTVEWLAFGDQQLHLILSDEPAPAHHHFGVDVDDFTAVYRAAMGSGAFDGDTFSAAVRELNDGSIQMYLRDPAGNLVEVNCRDSATLDRSAITEIRRLADERPQSASALRARLYPPR
jgi:catechol 2,3-dioxygenase-like lactoylglutathione lyase family enzyme